MQQYTVYLNLRTALRVAGGISVNHLELIALYLQNVALLRPLLLPVVSVTGWERHVAVTASIMPDTLI